MGFPYPSKRQALALGLVPRIGLAASGLDGEFRRARAIGIFAVKDGLPIGGRLEAQQIMRLMRETRRAT